MIFDLLFLTHNLLELIHMFYISLFFKVLLWHLIVRIGLMCIWLFLFWLLMWMDIIILSLLGVLKLLLFHLLPYLTLLWLILPWFYIKWKTIRLLIYVFIFVPFSNFFTTYCNIFPFTFTIFWLLYILKLIDNFKTVISDILLVFQYWNL